MAPLKAPTEQTKMWPNNLQQHQHQTALRKYKDQLQEF